MSASEALGQPGPEQFLGEFAPTATLHTNSWHLLELLRGKLGGDHGGRDGAGFVLSAVLLVGTPSGSSSSTRSEMGYSLGLEPPNHAQAAAMEASYTCKLSVV